MPNVILHKRNSNPGAVPSTGTLSRGELAINIADGKLYTKNINDAIINLGVSSISGASISPNSGTFNQLAVRTTNPYGSLDITPLSTSWGQGIVLNPAPDNFCGIFFRANGTSGSNSTGSWTLAKSNANALFIANKNHIDSALLFDSNGDATFGYNLSNKGNQSITKNYSKNIRAVLSCETSDNSPTYLTLNGSSSIVVDNFLRPPAYSSWVFTIHITAYNYTSLTSSSWILRGSCKKNNAYGYSNDETLSPGMSFVGSIIKENWSDVTMNNASVDIGTSANIDLGSEGIGIISDILSISVIGLNSNNIGWSATADITERIDPSPLSTE